MRRLAFVAALAVGSVAPAHESWLIPSKFVVQSSEDVRFDLTSGMAFPELESPIKPERVAKAAYRLNKVQRDLPPPEAGDTSLTVKTAFIGSGLATVWMDLHPRDIDLTDDDVVHYLDEIDAGPALRATWDAMKGKIPWHETYTKHVKTFVAVGDGASDDSWKMPVGSALELVPATDPRGIRPGGVFGVRLLLESAPLAGHPIGLRIEGMDKPVFRTTDKDGRATFPVARAGRAMLYTVELRRTAEGKAWASDFATLTFSVVPPESRD